MCAHLPAPRTVQVVGGAQYRAVCGGVGEGNFPSRRTSRRVGASAVPRMENLKRGIKENSTQGSRRS